MPLTFIHAADFHLGANLHRFGTARERLQDAQFRALEITLQQAVDNRAAFVLICGDLFDQRNPSPGIVRRTSEIFSTCSHMPVYILPGTHDFLSDNSVFGPGKERWTGDNIIILDNTITSPHRVPGVDCHLYFCPNQSNRSSTSPITGMIRQNESGYHIGLAHGSLQIGGLDFKNDYPIYPEDIKKTGLDYLALGHWHNGRLEKHGPTTVAYPGTSQPISWSDPEAGSVLVVRLEDSGSVEALPVTTSGITLKKIEATIYHPLEVSQLLEKTANPNSIVKLKLQYSDNFNDKLEVEKIIKKWSPRFLLMQSDNQKPDEKPALLGVPEEGHELLIKAFKAELNHLKEADSPEHAELYEKAASLGTRIITGEE